MVGVGPLQRELRQGRADPSAPDHEAPLARGRQVRTDRAEEELHGIEVLEEVLEVQEPHQR